MIKPCAAVVESFFSGVSVSHTVRRLLLMCAATDSTWRRQGNVWVGKCIHCKRKLSLMANGLSEGNATLEHIVPRTHGGTNDLTNLSVACARCNHQKGRRIDVLPSTDDRYLKVVDRLVAEKSKRLRSPVAELEHLFLYP